LVTVPCFRFTVNRCNIAFVWARISPVHAAHMMLKSRRSSGDQRHIDGAKSERESFLRHGRDPTAIDERAPDKISRYFGFADLDFCKNNGSRLQRKALESEAGETTYLPFDALIVPLEDG